MTAQSPIIEAEKLTVAYGHVEAVRDVSLKVFPGEFVAVIGNNGAGKSSTLKAIAGLVKPVAGTIKIDGATTNGLPAHTIVKRGVSLVPEGRMIFADQSVMDNLLLGTYSRKGLTNDKLDEDLGRIFELFPILKERHRQQAGSLSGGEQQMLALGRGLLARPKVLMIDEMSLGLAPRVLEVLFPVLDQLNRQGLAILLVEQLATLALKAAARGYVFANSRIILHGSSAELASNEEVIEAYLGRRSER